MPSPTTTTGALARTSCSVSSRPARSGSPSAAKWSAEIAELDGAPASRSGTLVEIPGDVDGLGKADRERRPIGQRDGLDARDDAQALDERAEQALRPLGVVAERRAVQLEHQRVIDVEARRERRRVPEAAHEQQCGGEKQRRAGNLGEHEQAADPRSADADHRLAPHHLAHVRAAGLQRGDERRENAGERDQRQREADDARVEHEVQALRDRGRQAERRQQVGAPRREEQRGRAADRCEQDAFDHQLPEDSSPASRRARCAPRSRAAAPWRAPAAAPRR